MCPPIYSLHLFTCKLPKVNNNSKTKSLITSYNQDQPNIQQQTNNLHVHVTIDFCCLTLFHSGNGTFVGVGTAEGDISVYIAWSLAVSVDIK